MEVFRAALALILRSMVVAARWAGERRLLCLRRAAAGTGEVAALRAELMGLQDENRQLKSENSLLKSRLRQASRKRRYSPMQRLQILWHMAYYGIPRSRVKEHFCIARSTLYRWLHAAEKGIVGKRATTAESPRKTPQEIARLIWDVFESNPHFGRHRIAMTVWALGVFIAASTVRNVLLPPKPRKAPAAVAQAGAGEGQPRQIVARYPNHVWSLDRTRVYRWGLFPTWVLVAIDHFSRTVMAVCPLEGPNAGWVIEALESAFDRHGAPKHIITDQEGVFICQALRELLERRKVKQRFGAVGKHGSIAVTERVILTLKHEWLRRVPLIRGMDHLAGLLEDFEQYYNHCRGHMTLDGAAPAAVHRGDGWQRPARSAKLLPRKIERRLFAEPRITAYRLAA